jgi:hypothetical protein
MKKYIFLDNWVYSKLTNSEFERRLTAFIKDNGYIVIFTIVSLVELYNPDWKNSGVKDRTERTAFFLSNVPCVIIDPIKIHTAEIQAYFSPLDVLPINLDLCNIPSYFRAKAVLNIFRHELLPIDIEGIETWSDQYIKEKEEWLDNKNRIIGGALEKGNLRKDKHGQFKDLEELKQQFLFSLDFREVDPRDIDSILAKLTERTDNRQPFGLTSIRIWSLCFWYLYIDIDNKNKIKIGGSDFGDLYQLSLLPYCAAFTLDGSMYKLLHRAFDNARPISCALIREKELNEILQNY